MAQPQLTNVNGTPDQSQSAFPYRQNYVEPAAGGQSAIRVDAPAGTFTGTAVEVADAAIRDAAAKFKTYLASVNVARYSEAGLAEQIAAFQTTDAAKAATAAAAKVYVDSTAADRAVADVRAALTGGSDDVATQLAAQAYWKRKVRLLDSLDGGSALMTAAQELIANAAAAEVPTLATELPDYLVSRNVADTSWIGTALAARVPELAAAIADASVAAKAAAITRYNENQLTDRLTNTTRTVGYRSPVFVSLDAVTSGA